MACYLDNALIGIWDPGKKAMRAAAEGEAGAAIQPAALMEAIKKGLPTLPRQWTDAKGRALQARVTAFDFTKGVVSHDIPGRGVIRDHPLADLALEDQSYVICAGSYDASLPEDSLRLIKERFLK